MTSPLLQYHQLVERLGGEVNAHFPRFHSAKLKTLESRLQPDVLTRYRRARQHYEGNGGHPVVEVTNGACWCGCRIPAYQHFLLRSQALPCEQCGRLLVRVFDEAFDSTKQTIKHQKVLA